MLLRSICRLGFVGGVAACLGSTVAAQAPGQEPEIQRLNNGVIEAPVEAELSANDIGPGAGAGHGRWSSRIGLFELDDQGDGNPFLDESLTVIEPVVLYEYNLSELTSYWLQFSYDNVSSASIDRLSEFPDQSGASGDNYISLDGGISHRTSRDVTWAGRAHASSEYDYLSVGLGGSATVESEDRNSSWTYSLDTYFDSLDLIRFDGTEEGSDERISASAGVSWYQVLTPSAHATLGFTAAYQTGFLATPYNAVVNPDPNDPPNPNLANQANGTEITEVLPDERLRLSLHGRLRKRVGPSTSLELGGRIYDDDWGIQSFTIEPRIYQELSENFRMSLRYRLYDQTAADDFAESFTTAPEFRTQDSDLREFDSSTIGLTFTWDVSARTALDLTVDMIDRSDDLDQLAVSVGWRRDF